MNNRTTNAVDALVNREGGKLTKFQKLRHHDDGRGRGCFNRQNEDRTPAEPRWWSLFRRVVVLKLVAQENAAMMIIVATIL